MDPSTHKGQKIIIKKQQWNKSPVLGRCLFVVLLSSTLPKNPQWVRLGFVSEWLCRSASEKKKVNKQAYKLENVRIIVIFTAFILRVLLMLCTEQDRLPSEEEGGSLILNTRLHLRTESQHANTNVPWKAICFNSWFLHYKQLEELVKTSMLLHIVCHSTWSPFLGCMLNSSGKHRVSHSAISPPHFTYIIFH